MKAILVLVLGCAPEKEPDERQVSPIGSPFPMDTNDTVIDDPNLIPGNMAGTIELTADVPMFGGSCDSTFELIGTPYTGYCPGCTFNFTVVAQETRDGTGECPPPENAWPIFSHATFQLWLWELKTILQFSRYWTGASWYGYPVVNDPALAWGVQYYPDPLAWPVAYANGPYGNLVDFTSTTIDWTIDWYYYDTYYGTGPNEIHSVGHVYIIQ